MKKLLAMLLSLVMLLAFAPATLADGADFTLVIEGGEAYDVLEVPVMLTGSEKYFGATFDLTYNADQITFVDYTTGAADMTMINSNTAGVVKCVVSSAEGMTPNAEEPMMTLRFKIAEGLEAGTEIAFALADGAFAETVDPAKPVACDIVADFQPYVVGDSIPFTGIVKFNEGEVEYKGATPFVVWDHDAGIHEPAFTVYEEDGETVIDPKYYDYEYKENTMPGTGYLFVTFKNGYTGEAQLFFKIYLPATTNTTVENVAGGILVTWDPVEDAAGYVIYRRAWSSTTNGWTAFARWDNTTELSYLDGHDSAHQTYAGTRYQYGVKAYFARRTDPVAGTEIGGNVNEDSGNFNLGLVGPLKTTVRITTRKLTSATAGSKQMTIKWEATKNFTGIQVQYATDANFKKNAQNYKIEYKLDANGNVVTPVVSSDVIKNLTSGTTYYVRIRSYQFYEGMNYYGEWSNVLSCKVK
ncbi:MAG: hypothetical protein II117_03040 [Clostridia bacterium]|nr:hypothetical protein [Clostridia bacterium]